MNKQPLLESFFLQHCLIVSGSKEARVYIIYKYVPEEKDKWWIQALTSFRNQQTSVLTAKTPNQNLFHRQQH